MKDKTCCFTGHRTIPPNEKNIIQARLNKVLKSLIENGYLYFGAGGALGFDTLAAKNVLSFKKRYPDIRLILVLPCRNQTKYWKSEDIAEYKNILKGADKVVYTSEQYCNGCMQKRNMHLIDCSSICIAYCSRQSGGTAFTVNYAHENHVPVINLFSEK